MNADGGPQERGNNPSFFANSLFARAAREDLTVYDARGLAILAASAWQHFSAPRPRQASHVRIFNPPANDAAQLGGISVIEAVNDDMAFLLDSTLAALTDEAVEIRLVVHPVLPVTRDLQGRLAEDGILGRESYIHIHVARIEDEARRNRIIDRLNKVYADIRISVVDWAAMRARVEAQVAYYSQTPPPLRAEEVAEAAEFLDWLARDNFIFLGLRDYHFEAGEQPNFDAVGGSGLGTLRDPAVRVLRSGREFVTMSPEVLEFLHDEHALIVTKANVKSRVHRFTQMDYVGVKLFAPEGYIEGELRIVGLFTASAYTQATRDIPFIRRKVAHVLDHAGLEAQSHSGKVLANVLETYPRDELFQIDVATLGAFAGEIATLYERPRLRVLARPDRFNRFVSVLTFLPRDRYDTRVRRAVGAYLAQMYNGRVSAVYPFYPEGPLVRTHYIIGRDEGETPQPTREQLEADIAALIQTWPDALRAKLQKAHGAEGLRLADTYGAAFSAAYRDVFSGDTALADIAVIEKLTPQHPRAVMAWRPADAAPTRLDLKVFSRGRPLPLSERVPLLENHGFTVVSEQTFEVALGHVEEHVWLHDMALESSQPVDLSSAAPLIEQSLLAALNGETQSDGYDRLVQAAGLGWRDIAILRTLSRYLRQIRFRFSQDYMWMALARHGAIAARLLDLIHARFDPARGDDRAAQEAAIVADFENALRDVTSLDDDRILRRFLNLAQAAVRSNIYQREADGGPRETITFKFESQKIDGLPLPRPLYEITVYSPRVEGIHLRFGKVARGGLRWSDRPQDFRTEILGLVKAQQVKNAVIVPVGAKGGFVPLRAPPPSQREAFMKEGVAAYQIFVASLLDLTDNFVGAALVPPPNTVRHDGDDPYLVVAADKGTATFSDIANAISLQKHHWLGDAFASGGSVGYDHKKMGITARGAWEAVKRHFREMDIDIQTQGFTVAGVGDMSGDVFGNGMLLSPEIRLVAAFDHRDIFLDPTPDPARSLAERRRLFNLPRSSWQDYDHTLLSEGGGIFSRAAKEVPLSPQIQAALGLHADSMAPADLLTAILKAPVDLLWFGGIGTYVRAASESDDQVGDRANDSIRVTGADLQCKVVGEGANLGMTQLARIEAARRGVRLNTDAIDNSAGVNTSDVEVNIKIALSQPVSEGALDEAGRNALLASMTDAVGALVLRNNYQQSLALSLAQRRGADDVGFLTRLMRRLEEDGRLDREVEFLPDDSTLNARARAGEGAVRPELAVLLAYAKLSLHDALLASNVPDDPYLSRELTRYFPQPLREAFPRAVETHRLRREIVATALANALINRGGPTIVARIGDETGADAAQITRAFAAVRDSFGLTDLNGAIDALDAQIPGALQLDLYAQVQELMLSRLVWFIRNVDFSAGLEQVVSRFQNGVRALGESLAEAVPSGGQAAMAERLEELEKAGVPGALAVRLAALPQLAAAPDIVLVSERANQPAAMVAATFFAADESFALSALAAQVHQVQVKDYYDRLALDRAMDQIEQSRRRIAAEIVAHAAPHSGEPAVAIWLQSRGPDVARIRKALADIAMGGLTLSKATVAASLLGDLSRE